jgi:DNA-binding NarL/FixJ family response regulator
MNQQCKIVIADDHPIVRQGLRQMIESDPMFMIAGEAGDGENALRLIELHRPQIAVIDIDMPQMGGFDIVREIRRKRIEIEIIFLTMHSEEVIFRNALDLGAKGYVLKDSAATDIIAAIKSVAKGNAFVSPALTGHLLNRRRQTEELHNENPRLDHLTLTERRVLKLIADDKTSKEIGEELFISPRTVDTHRANIAKKLGIRGSFALLKFAVLNKSEL